MAKPLRKRDQEGRAELLFAAYCGLGVTRTLRSLRESLQLAGGTGGWCPAISTLEKYSTLYDWQRRSALFDQRVMERVQTETEDAVVAMNRRQANVGAMMQALGARGLGAMNEVDLRASGLAALANLIAQGAKVERVARGEVSDTHGQALEFTLKLEPPSAPDFVPVLELTDDDLDDDAR